MAYTLQRLAAGSYDILLHGRIIGSLVSNSGRPATWTAELLTENYPLPSPFMQVEHTFQRFEDVLQWLGSPEVRDDR